MPKLLIVDDEETIRAGLSSMVRRLLPHWEIVGCCEDAEEACERLEKSAPDLAIIDIGMTGMSGLELAMKMNKEKPEISKIMLTGYDKFAYVQSALRAGAADYLLKPVQRDELVEAIRKVEGLLAERRRSSRLMLERAVADWTATQKPGSLGELERLLEAEGWLEEDVVYGILLEYGHGNELRAEEAECPSDGGLAAVLRERAGAIMVAEAPLSPACRMVFVAGRELSGALELTEGYRGAYVGYGEPTDDLRLLPSAFREAQEMLYRNLRNEEDAVPEEEAERVERLSVAIEMNDLQAVVQALRQWRDELGRPAGRDPVREFARAFRFVAFFAGLQTSRTQSALLTEMNAEISRLTGRLFFTGDPEALLEAIEGFAERIASFRPERFDERKIIGKVKELIKREFMNPDFSLEQAAHGVHLNPTYLSELFKETSGRKFIDYLTDVRLDEARRLLQETDLKMYEVCEAVGYTSSKYFSTLFRKKFGVTPTAYRDGPGAEPERG